MYLKERIKVNVDQIHALPIKFTFWKESVRIRMGEVRHIFSEHLKAENFSY